MAWFSQIGMAAMLLLLTIANPVMMCLQPGASLSPAEQACCKRMGPMCASSGMGAKHSCCRVATVEQSSVVTAVHDSTIPVLDLERVAARHVVEALVCLPMGVRSSFVSPSPPQPSLSSLQVFRI